jgi:Flp pilus assembly pilin Flp
MRLQLWDLVLGEDGQDLVEYALLASLLSIVSILALHALGLAVHDVFREIRTRLL